MNVDYENLISLIRSLNLNENETFNIAIATNYDNKRHLAMKALLETEALYLRRITTLLTKTFKYLNNDINSITRTAPASKDQVAYLLHHFPMIFSLHVDLHRKLSDEVNLQDQFGVILFEFLSQTKLLDIYENYVVRISKCLSIAKTIEKHSSTRNDSFKDLSHIIISPVQRFPQLSLVLGDILKNTPDENRDKICLFKAVCLVKSITARLDRRRRNYEYRDFKNMSWLLSKLKLDFSSTKLLSTNSVFELRGNFQTPEKVIKIPYNLMLCDRNVVMMPKESAQLELSTKVVFSYNIGGVDFWPYAIPRHDEKSRTDISTKVKNLYQSMAGVKSDDSTISEYDKTFRDFSFLLGVEENLKKLNFKYPEIINTVSKSLVELESRLKENERDLNQQMSAIVMIKCQRSSERKLLLFESARNAGEWRVEFNRTKLLSETQLDIDWLYYSTGSNFEHLSDNELPLVFQPYSIKSSSAVVRCHPVTIVLGNKVCRCLWCCLDNGWITILHFDYRQWEVIETFQLDNNQTISALCDVTELVGDNSKQIINSELMMATGNNVFIFSLINNCNSHIETKLILPTEIKSICSVNGVLLVALNTNVIIVYCKFENSVWTRVSDISLESFRRPHEEIKNLIYGNALVYVVYDKVILVLEVTTNNVLIMKNKFESDTRIVAFTTTSDGVWLCLEKENSIILYDSFLNIIYNIIALPIRILSCLPIGSVTTIFTDDKYIWLGTENGFIICISIIDSLYCVDKDIPMYCSAKYSNGAITNLIPFQNSQSILAKTNSRHAVDQQDSTQQIDKLSIDDHDPNNAMEGTPIDETDALSYRSLQSVYNNWKNSSLTLILALGSGISNHVNRTLNSDDHQRSVFETDTRDQSTIFTFFE